MRHQKNYFQGYYFKHQKDGHTLCLIVGRAGGEKFLQVITEKASWRTPLPEGNHFSKKGVALHIRTPELSLTGKIRYRNLTPIRYDIMGPFALLPLECSHGVISMRHHLEGSVVLNGENIDFTGGLGYIEMDQGRSFPAAYAWVQANDFAEDCSVMAAVATIPVWRWNFRGCICVVHYHGKEYRLATYLGVKVLCCSRDRILLRQGKYRLEIRMRPDASGHPADGHAKKQGNCLFAPQNGNMTRTIIESAACPADFLFCSMGKSGRQIFCLSAENASVEYEEGCQ